MGAALAGETAVVVAVEEEVVVEEAEEVAVEGVTGRGKQRTACAGRPGRQASWVANPSGCCAWHHCERRLVVWGASRGQPPS